MRAMGLILLSAVAVALPTVVSAQSKPVLDYGFYKSRVEPIFLANMPFGFTHAASRG